MSGRSALIEAFLAAHGYGHARRTPLVQDASARRYVRLTGGPAAALLMDAPPPEDVRAFVAVARHLADAGLSAPAVLAADERAGLLLVEDLGDAVFTTMPAAPASLLDAAIDALLRMQATPAPGWLPRWDVTTMIEPAVSPLLDWWWPATFGGSAPAALRPVLVTALETMLRSLPLGGFVHRDFHAGNLMWLPARADVRRVGVLDFQSAAIGCPAYDVASLIEDARRDVPEPLRERAIARYLAGARANNADFRAAVAVCAAHRHLRIAGQFVRLAVRDGKPHYLPHGPRIWAMLEGALTHPACAPLAEVLAYWIPSRHRCNPPGLAAA